MGIEEPNIDQLIDRLPLTGTWHLMKSAVGPDQNRYYAKWEETVGHRINQIACYGGTPRQAMEKLVREIRGGL